MQSLHDLLRTLLQADLLSKIVAALASAALLGIARYLWKSIREQRITTCLERDKYTPSDAKENALVDYKTQVYIPPDCQNNNPASGNAAAKRRPLFAEVDTILGPPLLGRFSLLLADSGMGKSAFFRNYYLRHWRNSRKRRQFQLLLVPLSRPDANEFIKAVPLQERGNTVLFLDGLDEDPEAITDLETRFKELTEIAGGFRSVFISCRTQFLPKNIFLPEELLIPSLGGPLGLEGGADRKVRRLYLSPFSERQTRNYLAARFPLWRRPVLRCRAIKAARRFGDLMSRPLLLSYIDELALAPEAPRYLFEAYEIILNRWLIRETKRRALAAQKEDLLEFCEELAVNLFFRAANRIPQSELDALAGEYSVKLDPREVRERSLLHHDSGGNWQFVHRSIMEYLVVRQRSQAAGPQKKNALPWTYQMRLFAKEMLLSGKCKVLPGGDLQRMDLSHADLRGVDLRSTDLTMANLTGARLAGADLVGADLTRANLASTDFRDARGLTVRQVMAGEMDCRGTLWPANAMSHSLREINSAAMTPDGRRFIASDNTILEMWDLDSTQRKTFRMGDETGLLTCASLTPDGQRAVCGYSNGLVEIWDLEKAQLERTLQLHSATVTDLAVTPDGCKVVSSSDDHTLEIWDLRTGQGLHTLHGHSYHVNSVALFSKGRRVASISRDHTLKVWDLETGRALSSLILDGWPKRVKVSEDGRRAIILYASDPPEVWDISNGRRLNSLQVRGSVSDIWISADGSLVVSASVDTKLRIWNVISGTEKLALEGHTKNIWRVTGTPYGERIVSIAEDQTIRVWF